MRKLVPAIIAGLLFSSFLGAQIAQQPNGGGTAESPYLIANLSNLYWIAESSARWSFAYRQTAHINAGSTANWFNGQGWPGIGNTTTFFTGSYDGGNFAINYLQINRTTGFDLFGELNGVGLFGCVGNAEIRDLSVNFTYRGGLQTGGLAGYAGSGAVISNCSAFGYIQQTGPIDSHPNTAFGGLVGLAVQVVLDSCHTDILLDVTGNILHIGGMVGRAINSEIRSCNSTGHLFTSPYLISDPNISTGGLAGTISGTNVLDCRSGIQIEGRNYVGGLVGRCLSGSVIERCIRYPAWGDNGIQTWGDYIGGVAGFVSHDSEVRASASSGFVRGRNKVGGLVGASNGILANCYSRCRVVGWNQVGGLLGGIAGAYYDFGNVVNCYSTGLVSGSGTLVGGLVGGSYGAGVNSGCYWDVQTSGQTSSIVGSGRTTAQMTFPHSADTYAGWDFDTVWTPDYQHLRNDGYPYLRDTFPGSPADDPAVPPPTLRLNIRPNPFSGAATLGFELPKAGSARLEIFNLRGQRVRSFDLSGKQPGEHSVVWDGRDDVGRSVGAGVYLIRLQSGGQSRQAKAVLVR